MSEPIILEAEAAAICEKLGLEPRVVLKLEIERRRIVATLYRLDETGSKYLLHPRKPALETREYEVVV